MTVDRTGRAIGKVDVGASQQDVLYPVPEALLSP